MYEKTVLSNGLTIISHYMPSRVSVSLGLWIKAGARYEGKEINGISHFLEHVLFKGTARRSCEELKQAIEGIGGSFNGFTSQEVTCYLATVPGKYRGSALDVLADMVLNATLSPKDIEVERKVILEEIRMYKDLPSHFVMDMLTGLLWPGQPLGRNVAGESDTVSRIDRKKLAAYKGRFYRLDNIVVAACGNLKHSRLVDECGKHLSLSAGKDAGKKGFVSAKEKQAKPQVKFHNKNTEQTHLALGLHSLAKAHPERFVMNLLNIILGGNMSSRLFREVRETRGLAYDIGTSVKFFQDSGAFIVHAGIDNRKVVETLEIVLDELNEIRKTPVGVEELARAKEYYIGQLGMGLESTCEHMLWLGENFVSLNKFLYPEKIISRVKSIEAGDITRLAEKIFRSGKLNLALIGPLTNKTMSHVKERLKL